jgi:hypothetical protein
MGEQFLFCFEALWGWVIPLVLSYKHRPKLAFRAML